MRVRTAALLCALAMLTTLAALLLGGPRNGATRPATGMPAFVFARSTAARIEITHGGAALVLSRDGDDWSVPAQGGRGARVGRAEQLLAALAATTLDEARTAQPSGHARLGVDLASGTAVRVLAADGSAVAALVVGHGDPNGGGVFVRRPGEDQAWLAHGITAPSVELADWVDTTLLDVSPDEVASLIVDRAGAPRLVFTRGPATDGVSALLLSEPAAHPPLDRFRVGDAARAYRTLSWVAARRGEAPGAPFGRAVVTTRAGVVTTLTGTRDGADAWIALDGQPGWAFAIPAGRLTALLPALPDLLAYVAPPPPAPATPPRRR